MATATKHKRAKLYIVTTSPSQRDHFFFACILWWLVDCAFVVEMEDVDRAMLIHTSKMRLTGNANRMHWPSGVLDDKRMLAGQRIAAIGGKSLCLLRYFPFLQINDFRMAQFAFTQNPHILN